jgi:hypothetical protein
MSSILSKKYPKVIITTTLIFLLFIGCRSFTNVGGGHAQNSHINFDPLFGGEQVSICTKCINNNCTQSNYT